MILGEVQQTLLASTTLWCVAINSWADAKPGRHASQLVFPLTGNRHSVW
jgi:hypothetical protein